jgi:hypothetical protein
MEQTLNSPLPSSELIRLRTSRRTYLPEPLPDGIRKEIELRIKEASEGPLRTKMNFTLISTGEISDRKLKLGTYGFIKGARYFIAGQVQPSREAFLDYGFNLEKLILDFTGMDLGTCWLGGTFDRSEYAKVIGLKTGYVIPAITPIGYPAGKRGLRERIIRAGAGADKRIPPEKLFFDKNSGLPLDLPAGQPITEILESVRLAPSASNNQPWRIAAEDNLFHFYISRKPGYQKAFSHIDLQMVDMGIAMAHFHQVALEYHKNPVWQISPGNPPFQGCEQVISVLLQD